MSQVHIGNPRHRGGGYRTVTLMGNINVWNTCYCRCRNGPTYDRAEINPTTSIEASINTEVLDVVNVDTVTLPGQEAPPLAPTMRQMLGWMYKILRNRKRQTATLWELMADNETTVDAKATVSDDATTAIKQEIETGP